MISFGPLPDCFTEWLVRALRQQRLHFLKRVHRQTLQQSSVGLRGKGHSSTPHSLQPEIAQARYLQAWWSVLHKQPCLYLILSSCTRCSSLTTSENPDFHLKKPIFCINEQLKPAVIRLSFGDLGSILASRPVLLSLPCLHPKPLTYWKCSWQKLSLSGAGAQPDLHWHSWGKKGFCHQQKPVSLDALLFAPGSLL